MDSMKTCSFFLLILVVTADITGEYYVIFCYKHGKKSSRAVISYYKNVKFFLICYNIVVNLSYVHVLDTSSNTNVS